MFLKRLKAVAALATSFAGGIHLGHAQGTSEPLPRPTRIEHAVAYAVAHRREMEAARATALAAEFRQTVVAALPDPVLSTSLDHVPFPADNFDRSLVWEQTLTPAPQRRSRERAARADALRLSARFSASLT